MSAQLVLLALAVALIVYASARYAGPLAAAIIIFLVIVFLNLYGIGL